MASDAPCGGVLIVDDDPDIRDSLREVLEDEGYEVATVANGREALDHLTATGNRPVLIDAAELVMKPLDLERLLQAVERYCP